jgi:PTS system glucitol/sorbitol-specific IIA component
MIKYEATVTAVGPLVTEFIQSSILVFFAEGAPAELAEFSILHDGKELKADIQPDDVIYLDDQSYRVLAVGEVANSNFANLGHLIMKFNGMDQVELPGDVCVEAKPVPPIAPGTKLKIVQGES